MKNKKLVSFYILLLVVLLSYGRYNQQQRHFGNDVPQKAQARVVAKVDPRILVRENQRQVEIAKVKIFFKHYGSPLQDEAQTIVDVSYIYGLDYRLIPAISGVESTFGKNIAIGSYNAWGYMCGSHVCYFSSYAEAIKQVAKTISNDRAYQKYRQTRQIYDLATVYNYVHPEDWTQKIQYFIKLI